jgi:hypothetical protein
MFVVGLECRTGIIPDEEPEEFTAEKNQIAGWTAEGIRFIE